MAPVISSGDKNLENYPGKLTLYVTVTCIIAAMGGLIFGYDIGISGGVTAMTPFLQKFFPFVYRQKQQKQSNNQYCTFNSETLTLFTSSLYLAALLSCNVASRVTTKYGRRISMVVGGSVFFAGALLNAFATHISMLIIGRIFLGFGVGFATQAVPLYVSEMAPYKYRGALNVLFQLSITIGILAANVINYFTAKISGGWGWRLSLGGAAVPAIFMAVASFCLPDTPNSLMERGQLDEAKTVLKRIRGVEVDNDTEIEVEYRELLAASLAAKEVKHSWRNIMNREYRPQLTMSISIPGFQQFTGINVVMFYAPVLFLAIGFGDDAALLSAVITGGVNVVATFLSLYGTDKWGRRPLFMSGGLFMFVFQVAVAILIGIQFGSSGVATNLSRSYAIGVVTCICLYVAAFAWSWGPLGWLVPSEISPLEIRSAAQSITVSTNMLFTFVIAQCFLGMLCHLKFWLFVFFAAFVLIMTGFVYIFLPETKNKPIEEMVLVWRGHWFWQRFYEPSLEIGQNGSDKITK